MNILVGFRDNDTFMAIMAFPNKGLSFFNFLKALKAQNTSSCNTPYVTTKCTLATDAFKKDTILLFQPGSSKAEGIAESALAVSKRY